MGFINSQGGGATKLTVEINYTTNKEVTQTQWSRTTSFWSWYAFFIANFEMSYDATTGKMVLWDNQFDPITMQRVRYKELNGSLRIEVRGTTDYQEILSSSGGSSDSVPGYKPRGFRTDLGCNSASSTLNVSYPTGNTYELYFDGVRATRRDAQGNRNPIQISQQDIDNGVLQFIGSSKNDTTEMRQSSATYTTGSNSIRASVYCSSWVFPDEHKASFVNGTNTASVKLSNGQMALNCNGINPFGVNGSLLQPNEQSCYYYYSIDGENLNNTDDLSFSADGETWTGLTSPTFYRIGKQILIQINAQATVESSEPAIQTQGTYHTWTINTMGQLPTRIGNVTLNNPELVNPYTQDSSEEPEEGEEPEQVSNNIFKIIPNTFGESKALLQKLNPNVANKEDWIGVNCRVGANHIIYDIQDGAYVYQNFTRPKYSVENDNNDYIGTHSECWVYRQRHFTKYRYLECRFGVREDPEDEFERWSPNISLICNSYGNVDGHTWNVSKNPVVGYYDLLDCNKGGTCREDEYMSMCNVENLRLYNESAERGDDDYGVTYYAETPCTAYGYLPNIVGTIRINIPNDGKEYSVGNIETKYLTQYRTSREEIIYGEWKADDPFGWEWSLDPMMTEWTYGTLPNILPGAVMDFYDLSLWWNVECYSFKANGEDIEETDFMSEEYTQLEKSITDLNIVIKAKYTAGSVIDYTITISKHFDKPQVVQLYWLNDQPGPIIHLQTAEAENYDDGDDVVVIDGVMYRVRHIETGITLDFIDEFQKPIECGCRNPKPEDTSSEGDGEHQYFYNRYGLICINGARSAEIPQTSLERKTGSQDDHDWYTAMPLSMLKTDENNKGNRAIFPRDDLGELHFDFEDFNADDGGNYPINAMYQGAYGNIWWLADEERTVTESGQKRVVRDIYIEPRFDTFSGDYLYRFINNGNHRIIAKGDYGAVFGGLNSIDTDGDITDESPYNNSTDISFGEQGASSYYHKFHGTNENPETEISLTSSGKTRFFDKVVDGVKYWWAVSVSGILTGKILRNSAGKILRNSLGKILRGGEYE